MHPPQLHLPTLPRRSSLAVELQRPIRGQGEGRNALAAACRPVQAQGSPVLTTKEGKERGRRAAAVLGLIPSLLTHCVARPVARARSAAEKNMVDETLGPCPRRQARIPRAGTHDVRAPEPGLVCPVAYAEAARARGACWGPVGGDFAGKGAERGQPGP